MRTALDCPAFYLRLQGNNRKSLVKTTQICNILIWVCSLRAHTRKLRNSFWEPFICGWIRQDSWRVTGDLMSEGSWLSARGHKLGLTIGLLQKKRNLDSVQEVFSLYCQPVVLAILKCTQAALCGRSNQYLEKILIFNTMFDTPRQIDITWRS